MSQSKERTIYVNGKMVPESQAVISVLDRGTGGVTASMRWSAPSPGRSSSFGPTWTGYTAPCDIRG